MCGLGPGRAIQGGGGDHDPMPCSSPKTGNHTGALRQRKKQRPGSSATKALSFLSLLWPQASQGVVVFGKILSNINKRAEEAARRTPFCSSDKMREGMPSLFVRKAQEPRTWWHEMSRHDVLVALCKLSGPFHAACHTKQAPYQGQKQTEAQGNSTSLCASCSPRS